MENNRRYMLIAQTENGFYEINWTKLRGFKNLEDERHQLHLIDIFTKYYSNRTELLLDLINHEIISPNSPNINIRILPFIEKDGNRIFDNNPLVGEVIFKDTYEYLYDEDKIMSSLLELIKEPDFCTLLQKHYLESGKYSYDNLLKIQGEIYNYELLLIQEPCNMELMDIYHKAQNKYLDIQSIHSTLVNILLYNQAINNGHQYPENQYDDMVKNIHEFLIREIYYITKTNDDGTFDYLKTDNGYNKRNYEQTHNLCMLIQEYQHSKKKDSSKILRYEKNNKPYILDGQLPLSAQ